MPGKTILVVEDDESLADLITAVLTGAGYGVRRAGDSIQGLMLAHQLKPDLIVLDFMLPGGGGKAVHSGVRLSGLTAHTPVVLLTSVAEEQVMKAIDYDANTYYLGKPYQNAVLLNLLKQVLG
ncbi:MAG: response regulator [Elusimicrobia bacterium]|nr:response regulator [Elusimicrobiota bacterium]